VGSVASDLEASVLLLSDGTCDCCLIASHVPTNKPWINRMIRERAAGALGLPVERVLLFHSHNHCAVALSREAFTAGQEERGAPGDAPLTEAGASFLEGLERAVERLRADLEPVTVSWALGREGRITYNRKGRHDDGATYFMREEDRVLLGEDFRGEIDDEAPVVALRRPDGGAVCLLCSFAGHPVTAFHPERPVVFGEYPQVAGGILSASGAGGGAPVLFLQGCAGNLNSKGFLSGDLEWARRNGEMLGGTFARAAGHPTPSSTDILGFASSTARVPYAKLPTLGELERELAEIRDFRRRALEGAEDTLSCVGLNFPRAFTPGYRAALVDGIQPWTEWAIGVVREGRGKELPRHLEVDVFVVRLGDVAVVGLQGEPFMGIGRRIRRESPSALTICAGYVNAGYGYIPDGPNTGDREYMSSFYRYTRFRPPFRKPGGDALAVEAGKLLRRLYRKR